MKEERKRFVESVKQDKSAVLALSFLILVLLVSITVQWIPIDPDKLDVLHSLAAPSLQHPFGTDDVGRDYFIRVLYGGRVSLLIGFLAMVMSMSIGVALGLISGYFGGIIDAVLMRLVDVISSIPWIIMVMVIGMLFGRGFLSLVLVIGLLSWMEIARLIRSEVLSLKGREYVQYARFLGVPAWKILLSHIFPSILPTTITAATASVASSIMVESALSFLGRGISAPMSSWGSLLQNAQKFLQKAPYMAVLPGILIILTVLSFNKLGEVFRKSLEPGGERR
ncbi:MAG: ABC transporter permease [Lachnospiraceae bacterium]|jgi:oligopeptide ABC superfamily ATP binding cassette transporter, membrane protein|nr:ABC transporter permease [Lachnospiraceae bacterium]